MHSASQVLLGSPEPGCDDLHGASPYWDCEMLWQLVHIVRLIPTGHRIVGACPHGMHVCDDVIDPVGIILQVYCMKGCVWSAAGNLRVLGWSAVVVPVTEYTR